MEKVIRIKGREKTNRQGGKFIAFKALTKEGVWIPISFTQDVNNIPKKEGHYDMRVNTESMNKSKTDYGDKWWCKEVLEFTEAQFEDVAKDEF